MIRRIDRKIYNDDNPTVLNTLKDLKIMDNAALLVEIKSDSDLEHED